LFRDILTFPSRRLIYVIPATIITGLIVGYFFDTTPLKTLILPVTVFMIYPTMIGFRLSELATFDEKRLLASNLLLNFFVIPLTAYVTGTVLLGQHPELLTGLIIISVIPGGNMVIAFTMLFRGNVKAAIKLTAFNLVSGSFLAPLYLYVIVGKYIPVDLLLVFKTIAVVVFLPMIMGIITFSLLMKRYTLEEFKTGIKPLLPGISSWGLIYIVFTSVSLKSVMIFSYPELLLNALKALILFYVIIYTLTILAARSFFDRADGITLILNAVLRNLAISIGLASTAFGPQTAMLVALAFLFQQQSAVWFARLNERFGFLK
jgi:ACR3 family arsenite efflux pump ArsB